MDLIPVHKEVGIDDMYGFINKAGDETIPFIYDFVWNFDEAGFATVKRFGNLYAVNNKGTLYHNKEDAKKDGKKIKQDKETLGINEVTNIEEMYDIPQISREESLSEGFGGNYGNHLSWDDYPIKIGNHWGLGGYDFIGEEDSIDEKGEYNEFSLVPTKKIDSYCCDRIIYYNNGYFVYRIKDVCYLLCIDDPDKKYMFKADEIIPNLCRYYSSYEEQIINNVIIKRNKKYGISSLNGKQVLPIEYDLIVPTLARNKTKIGDIGIVWKDKKCTLVRMSDGIILGPFKYEDIIVNDMEKCSLLINSTYMIKEQGKIGCVDFFLKTILPPVYDSIVFNYSYDYYGYHYYMILYQEGKVGSYEYFFNYNWRTDDGGSIEVGLEFFVEPEYDECVFLNNKNAVLNSLQMSFVAVRKGNKWGILDNTPASSSYFFYDKEELYLANTQNYEDLDFKYDSLEALKKDADSEFKRRFEKYRCYDDYPF